jgi:hypothetical protein
MAGRPTTLARWASPGYLAALVATGAYSWWVATTTPFSVGADVATAIPLGVLGALAVVQWRADRANGAPARPLRRLDPAAATGAAWPLPTVLLAALAFELYNLFSAPRSVHPTVSSLYDSAAGTHAWKAVFVLAWLALGWDLLRR